MALFHSRGVRLKSKLTLRSLSELSSLRPPADDENGADGNAADGVVLAQRVVCAMRRGEDDPRGGRTEPGVAD